MGSERLAIDMRATVSLRGQITGTIRVVNRMQGLILGFFALAWMGLVALLVGMPEVLDHIFHLSTEARHKGEVVFVLLITAFLLVLAIGVVRRWRWTFWLITIAFLAGAIRIPVAVLQLSNVMPSDGPPLYEVLQAAIGLVQFALGVTMLGGYRTGGPWGEF
jgi:hypothetical protein